MGSHTVSAMEFLVICSNVIPRFLNSDKSRSSTPHIGFGCGVTDEEKKTQTYLFSSDEVSSFSNPVCNVLPLPVWCALPFRCLFIESSALT